jgi:hypothetical protein
MVMPEVRRLIVPSSTPGKPLWPKLSKFFAANDTISLVETKEPPDKSFRDFVRELSGKRSSGIHELKFSDAEYGAEFMVQLAILFESREITVLSVMNRTTETGIVTLAKLLPSCMGFQNLRELTLVGCPLIEAKDFLGPLPKLRTFTGDDDSLDIGQFLSQFCECTKSELEELTLLSGNVMSPLPTDGAFPPHLTHLVIPKVSWSGSNFCILFSILANRSSDCLISLNVNRASLKDEQWIAFNEFLQSFHFEGLLGLAFDGNRIGKGLPMLLAQSVSLQWLSLNGCIVEEPIVHCDIANSISNSKTLHNLSLQGGARHSYREAISEYMGAILANKSLRFVDISGNRVGNVVLELLTPIFLNHPKIGEVLFDQNYITDLEALRRLYNAVGQIDRRIFVRFPTDDVERLRFNKKIADTDVPRLRVQCADALRRKVKRGKDQMTAEDDGIKKNQIMKTGELLELLVCGKNADDGVFPEGVKELVDEENEEWIGDGQWINSIGNGVVLKNEERLIVEIERELEIDALFAAII